MEDDSDSPPPPPRRPIYTLFSFFLVFLYSVTAMFLVLDTGIDAMRCDAMRRPMRYGYRCDAIRCDAMRCDAKTHADYRPTDHVPSFLFSSRRGTLPLPSLLKIHAAYRPNARNELNASFRGALPLPSSLKIYAAYRATDRERPSQSNSK